MEHSADKPPPSSLIITSRNRPALLQAVVDSILQGTQVPSELIIIDQSDAPNSRLSSLGRSGECDVRYCWESSRGVSVGRNKGIAKARHDILTFTDDDVIAAADWLATITRSLVAAGPRCAVSGAVIPTGIGPSGFRAAMKADSEAAVYEGRVGRDVLLAANMAFRRSVVQEVGMFDARLGPGTRFPGAEDNDLGFRMLEAGFRIVYVPEAVIYHREWRSAQDYIRLRWAYGVGRGGFYAKHISLRDRYMLRRLFADIRDHVKPIASLASGRTVVGPNVVLVLGIGFGSCRWLLTERLRSALRGRFLNFWYT